ncbi:MAG: hypothetical protein ACYTEZ_01275 [Planctomycetota bacterium]|jgi:hypothetical protein
MATYEPKDLEGWEFKILRAATSRFKDPLALHAIVAEEARAGWELIEKFDDRRLRLKRRIAWREKDADLTLDPYRTWVGRSEDVRGLLLAGIILLAVLVLVVALALG